MDKIEQRAIIKYLQKKGLSPKEIHEDMVSVLGDDAPSYQIVKNWCRDFRCGKESCHQAPGAGPSTTACTPVNIDAVHDTIMADRRVMVQQLSDILHISVGSVETIVHEHLGFRKVAARWVPKMLSLDQKQNKVQCSRAGLELMEPDLNNFCDRFVTVDET